MNRDEAIAKIADGHAIYKAEAGKEILEALGVPWKDEYARPYFNEPDIWKGVEGIPPEDEGKLGVASLRLGSIACSHYKLRPESKMGRGFQGQVYASELRQYFITHPAEVESNG